MENKKDNLVELPKRKIETGMNIEVEVKKRTPEEEAEEKAKQETVEYMEKRYAGIKKLLTLENVRSLLEKSQTWSENWDRKPTEKKRVIEDTLDALGLRGKEDDTQGILVRAAVEAIKAFQIVSRMSPPRAAEFRKQIESNLDAAKIQDIENWRSWYSKGDGSERWEEIVNEVEAGKGKAAA